MIPSVVFNGLGRLDYPHIPLPPPLLFLLLSLRSNAIIGEFERILDARNLDSGEEFHYEKLV